MKMLLYVNKPKILYSKI